MAKRAFQVLCVALMTVSGAMVGFAEDKAAGSSAEPSKSNDSKKPETSSTTTAASVSNKFQVRWGIGGTVTIADTTWDVSPGSSFYFYKGGFQASIFVRVHPHVTLEASIGGLGGIANGTPGVYWNYSYGEFASNVGARFYVRTMDSAAFGDRFFIAPYVVATFLANVANQSPVDGKTTAYVGGHIGGGAEFRINSHMVAFADIRFIPRVGVSGQSLFPQLGLSLSGGFSYFF